MNDVKAQILAAFDAGERNSAELGRRFGKCRQTIHNILRANDRRPMTQAEAIRAMWKRGIYDGRVGRTKLSYSGDPIYIKLRKILGAKAARAALCVSL